MLVLVVLDRLICLIPGHEAPMEYTLALSGGQDVRGVHRLRVVGREHFVGEDTATGVPLEDELA
jgi:hypothetical protein